MDLPTHFVFAVAVGLIFFDKPEIALLIGLGALLPDLDREYWFMPERVYADEQIHRAGLHNVFVIAVTYLISPFFALGVFLHVLQDSFTTVKDRGVEWFFPLTRLVKRGLYNSEGKLQPKDPKEKIFFFQEDPKGLINKADPDLRVYGCDPIPWRRVYGFAQNSQILDRAFLFGSIAIILLWIVYPGGMPHFSILANTPQIDYITVGIGYASIAVLFFAGEIDRRDRGPIIKFKFARYAILGLGLVLFGYWLVMFSGSIYQNLDSIFVNPISIIIGIIILPLVVFAVVKWKTRNNRDAIV